MKPITRNQFSATLTNVTDRTPSGVRLKLCPERDNEPAPSGRGVKGGDVCDSYCFLASLKA